MKNSKLGCHPTFSAVTCSTQPERQNAAEQDERKESGHTHIRTKSTPPQDFISFPARRLKITEQITLQSHPSMVLQRQTKQQQKQDTQTTRKTSITGSLESATQSFYRVMTQYEALSFPESRVHSCLQEYSEQMTVDNVTEKRELSSPGTTGTLSNGHP